MPLDINESDWKAFKKLHTVALARYFDRAAVEIERLMAQKDRTNQERFWNTAEFIKQSAKQASRLVDDVRRSTAVLQLTMIYANDLVTAEEMAGFSPELRATVESNRNLGASSAQGA